MGRSHCEAVQNRLAMMEGVQREQSLLAKRMLEACEGAFYGVDLLAVTALNRSLAHCGGIKVLIEAWNIMCAGVVLRLQLDTVLRFYAATLVEDPQEFAFAVLEGQPIKKMKSKDGKLLQDAYLVQRLGEEYPWIPRVYKETSGYVHFSDKHMLTALFHDAQRGLRMKVSPIDEETPEELYLEIVEAFLATTDILTRYIEGWVSAKNTPEMIEGARKAREKLKPLNPAAPSDQKTPLSGR